MEKEYCILVINTGSTSTKIAVYDDATPRFTYVLRHSMEDLAPFAAVKYQHPFRKQIILQALEERQVYLSGIDAVVGRGGLIRPIESGTYYINSALLRDLKEEYGGSHASNLAGILAHEIAAEICVPAYIVDPVVVDELDEVARVTGCAQIKRTCVWHALNQKTVARRFSMLHGKHYSELNLIVAHMGGGCSVGAHCKGRAIDVTNALNGEGPFSAERPGTLPILDVMKLCFSGTYSTLEEMKQAFTGQMGLISLLGTNNGQEVVRRIEQGDKQAELAYRAMAYQISKSIGSAAAVLKGQVDAIILTGGFACDPLLMGWIREWVSFLAPVVIVPGEDEMEALALGALRVLTGDEKAKEYWNE